MFTGDEELMASEVKKFYWWIQMEEYYRDDDDYSKIDVYRDDRELIIFTDFVGGDFQNWVKIPYDKFHDEIFEDERRLTTLCFGNIDHGGFDIYRLELWEISEEDNAIYFKIREKM